MPRNFLYALIPLLARNCLRRIGHEGGNDKREELPSLSGRHRGIMPLTHTLTMPSGNIKLSLAFCHRSGAAIRLPSPGRRSEKVLTVSCRPIFKMETGSVPGARPLFVLVFASFVVAR